MPGLDHLARRMAARGQQVTSGTDRIVKRVASAASREVINATPADTGRAKANWQIGLGEPVTQAIDETDPAGAATIQRNESNIEKRFLGQAIHIGNPLPYIGPLDRGHSQQAPANFVRRAAVAAVSTAQGARVFED